MVPAAHRFAPVMPNLVDLAAVLEARDRRELSEMSVVRAARPSLEYIAHATKHVRGVGEVVPCRCVHDQFPPGGPSSDCRSSIETAAQTAQPNQGQTRPRSLRDRVPPTRTVRSTSGPRHHSSPHVRGVRGRRPGFRGVQPVSNAALMT